VKKTLALTLLTGLAFGTTAFAEGMDGAAGASGHRDHRGHHGHHGGFFMKKLDQNSDGKVTRDEVQADITARFTAIDANKDGKLTQDETAKYFEAKAGEMKAKFAERLQEADANKDGKWSKDELSKMPGRMFTKLDQNSDGFVTQAELEAGKEAGKEKFGRFKEKHGDFREKMFSRADANNDGVVDSAEALALAEKQFTKMDSNGDGVVEGDELKAGRGHHGGKHGDCHGDKGKSAKGDTTDPT